MLKLTQRTLHTLLLLTFVCAVSCGCGQAPVEEATPEEMETIRQEHMQQMQSEREGADVSLEDS